MKHTLLKLATVAAMITGPAAMAQPPNNNCWEAEVSLLTVDEPVVRNGNNEGATDDLNIGVAQVWEAFTVTECVDLTVAYCGTDPVFEAAHLDLYVECGMGGYNNRVRHPGTGIDQFACGDDNFTIPYFQIPPGTYYVLVQAGPGSIGDYTLTLTATPCAATPPDNDECAGAITLVPNTTCVTYSADVDGAPAGTSLPAITCAGFTGDASDDVWFKFVATAEDHTIIVSPSAQFDATVDLRAGTCGSTATIGCSEIGGSGGAETLNAAGLTIGETYYVRVNDWWSGLPITTTFDICIIGPAPDVCEAFSGTLEATSTQVCLEDGEASLTATPAGDAVVPDGFSTIYVLTAGEDLVIQAVAVDADFMVTMPGTYTIHTLVYDETTLDLSTVEPGVTTGADVLALLEQGGGDICGHLDVTGAEFMVEECIDCDAFSGTLEATSTNVCLLDGEASLIATPTGNAVVPDGYSVIYVLTAGEDLVIQAVGVDPDFMVTMPGTYTIHTLVYDETTLDLSTVEPGVTTGADVLSLLIQGGGEICGHLDVAGAPFTVVECVACDAYSGTLEIISSQVCLLDGEASLMATPAGDAIVPDGYSLVHVLTAGEDLVIQAVGEEADFMVTMPGTYTIHTLVYDETTLDLSIVEPGVTTGLDVLSMLQQGGGVLCGHLDVTGAAFTVVECEPCDAEAGTLDAVLAELCLLDGSATMEAIEGEAAMIPDGYEQVFVLTQGINNVIISVSLTPVFEAGSPGLYTMHSLVFDPTTLNLASIELGVTTAAELNMLLQQGGGVICAALDLAGAVFTVEDCTPANNDCSVAQPLNVHTIGECAGNEIEGTTIFAGFSGIEPDCDPSDNGYADVWYIFNSGDNDQIFIDVVPGSITSWGVAVYSDCAGTDLIHCVAEPDGPVIVNTMPDTDHLIMVYTNLQSGQTGDFSICLTANEAVNFCLGGTVTTNMGEDQVLFCSNAPAGPITFVSAGVAAQNYTYILTDDQDMIIDQLTGNTMDFTDAPLGTYRVYGVSFNGSLQNLTPGEPLSGLEASGDCISISSSHVTIVVEICNSIASMAGLDWSVYPNPTRGELNISYTGATADMIIELHDLSGRLLHTERLRMNNGERHPMQVAGLLAPGMYTITLQADGSRSSQRIIVE